MISGFAAPNSGGRKRNIVKKRTKPCTLYELDIEKFLMQMKKDGRSDGTLSKYRSDLNRFRGFLGMEGIIYPDSLLRWKGEMLEAGYAPRTINGSIVAVNQLYEYIGCRDWQLFERIDLPENDAPELTREEYRDLLLEARKQENVQLYLIVKTLACTDLTPSDLPFLTREAVNEGKVRIKKKEIFLPDHLREELLDYAMQHGLKRGAIFINRNRNPHDRVVITRQIAALGDEAGLEPGKANPRNLRRLHLNTLAELQKQADAWIFNSYRELLEGEEKNCGWRIR